MHIGPFVPLCPKSTLAEELVTHCPPGQGRAGCLCSSPWRPADSHLPQGGRVGVEEEEHASPLTAWTICEPRVDIRKLRLPEVRSFTQGAPALECSSLKGNAGLPGARVRSFGPTSARDPTKGHKVLRSGYPGCGNNIPGPQHPTLNRNCGPKELSSLQRGRWEDFTEEGSQKLGVDAETVASEPGGEEKWGHRGVGRRENMPSFESQCLQC